VRAICARVGNGEAPRRTLIPFYAQVQLSAPAHPNGWPKEWADGDEYSAARYGVAVGTIGDLDGEVRVSVFLGGIEPTGHDLMAVVPVELPEGRAEVGNSVAEDNVLHVDVAPGAHEVAIYVDARPATSVVFVLS
jgi:hypothetical protein